MTLNCININNPLPILGFNENTTSSKDENRFGFNKDENRLDNELATLAKLNQSLIKTDGTSFVLGRYAKKDLRTAKAAENLFKKYPNSSRYVGSLPVSWLDGIKKDSINEYTQKVFELFSTFAKQTTCKREELHYNYKEELDEFGINFEKLTGKKAQIKYLNEGTIGRTYKLTVNDEDFVVKTFFTNPIKLGYYTLHGKGAEILGAVYAKENASKGDFADFYFGKFAKSDDFDGFIVMKYIDYSNAKSSYTKNLFLERNSSAPIQTHDLVNNTVMDTVIDYGELRKGKLKK